MGLEIVRERRRKIKNMNETLRIAAFVNFLIFLRKYKAKNIIKEMTTAAKPDLDLVKRRAK
jgi:hypothetical protein